MVGGALEACVARKGFRSWLAFWLGRLGWEAMKVESRAEERRRGTRRPDDVEVAGREGGRVGWIGWRSEAIAAGCVVRRMVKTSRLRSRQGKVRSRSDEV